MECGAPAGPGRRPRQGRHGHIVEPAPGERFDHPLTFPGLVNLIVEMLGRTAAAIVEMAAGGRGPVRSLAQPLDRPRGKPVAALTRDAHPQPVAGQAVGDVITQPLVVGDAVARRAEALDGQLHQALLSHGAPP